MPALGFELTIQMFERTKTVHVVFSTQVSTCDETTWGEEV
jgi:hypothetical protein